MNVGSLTILLGANTAGLRAAGLKVRAFERGIASSSQRINRSLATVGQSFSALSIPIALVGGVATKMFSDFEFELAKVEGLVGVAGDKVAEWGEKILEIGPKIGRMPQELAEGLFFVTSAGIRGAETMDVLEKSGQAAAVGLGETKVVVDAVTSAMNAYGKENLNATQATDDLIMAIREGKVEPGEFASSIGKAIPIAAKLGVQFNEVGAAMAAMTRTGTKAGTSAIFLRRVLSSLLRPTGNAHRALAEMGTTFHDLRAPLKDEGGLLKTLMKLRDLTDEFGDVKFAEAFPNLRALIPILDLIGENFIENIGIWDSMLNSAGALDKATQAVANTFKHQWNQAVSDLQTSMIKLGGSIAQAVLPILRQLVGWIRQSVEWWNKMEASTQQMILKIAGITAVVGPLVIILGTLLNAALIPIRIAIFAIGAAMKVLNFALITNPIVGVIAAVIALGVAIAFVIKNMDVWKQAWPNMYASFKIQTHEVITWLISTWDRFTSWMNNLFGDATTGISKGAMSFLFGGGKNFEEMNTLEKGAAITRQILNNVRKGQDIGMGWLFDVDEQGTTKIKKQIEVVSGITDVLEKRRVELAKMKAELAESGNDIGFADAARATLNDFKDTMASLLPDLKGMFTTLPGIAKEAAEDTVEAMDPLRKMLLNIAKTAEVPEAAFMRMTSLLREDITTNTLFSNLAFDIARVREQMIALGGDTNSVMWGLNQQVALYEQAIEAIRNKPLITDDDIARMHEMEKSVVMANLALDIMQAGISAMVPIFSALGEGIGKSMAGAEGAFDGLLSAIIDVFKQIGKLLITAGALLLLIPGFQGLGASLLIGGTGLIALTAYTQERISQDGSTRMATGGIIPPGFNNDTFDAKLSTDEAVIPLDRLPQLLGLNSGNNNGGEVRFVIENDTLVGVLENGKNISNAF